MSRAVPLLGYALASFLAFPQPLGSRVIDLGVLLGWLAPALLVVGLAGESPRRAAAAGFAAGLLAHSAILHWIYVVTVVYGHAPVLAGVVTPVLLAAYIAAFSAGFGAGAAWLERRRLASPLALALLWTALDHLRSVALSGFPWATLGYAQHLNPALMALAPYTGVYGLSFVSALGGAALGRGFLALRAGRAPGRGVWLALAGVALAHGLGLAALTAGEQAPARALRVAVLQGNIEQELKWDPAWAARTVAIYEDLSRRAAAEGAEVIVWPESSFPGGLPGRLEDAHPLVALARETRAVLVVGGVGVEVDARGQLVRFTDSAYLLDPAAGYRDRYDKAHLVPFGEYVPLRDWLFTGLRAVAAGLASGDVSAGPGPRPLVLHPPGSPGRTVTFGVPICYELLFPDLVRRFVRDGAEILFAITNDAWYGRTGAPYQFLAMTAMRSAETRVWTARAANTGVSAIIDDRGRVRRRTRIFERDLLVADVPLRPAPVGGSFYARHGDWFAGACWLFLLVLAGAGLRRGEG